MAYPTKPTLDYDYTGFAQSQGNNAFPGSSMDNDLQNLKTAIDEIIDFVSDSIRSDNVILVSSMPEAADLTTYTEQSATSATAAAGSATAAASSATAASTSAATAATQAGNASTSATNASSSASAASTSATNASNSAAAAITTLSTSCLKANNLSDLASAATARTNLGLGALATQASVTAAQLPTGAIVGGATATYTTNADITTSIPNDDTIPQSGEGTQIISVSYTPTSATNKLRLRFTCAFVTASTAGTVIAALFDGQSANALSARFASSATSGSATTLVVEHEYVPGVTTALTFAVRMGGSATFRLNGGTSGRAFGGVSNAMLTIEEVKV